MARARSHLPTGWTRFTSPSATVPAGSTSRSNANTDSRSFASTGAPRRFGTRLARYRRSGTPEGTLSVICGGASSVDAVWADNESGKKEIAAARMILNRHVMGHPLDAIHHITGNNCATETVRVLRSFDRIPLFSARTQQKTFNLYVFG